MKYWQFLLVGVFGVILAACGPAAATVPQTAPQTQAASVTQSGSPPPVIPTHPPVATSAPAITTARTQAPNETRVPVTAEPLTTPTPFTEERRIELEWPLQMRLGDSGLVRLALIPDSAGYVVTTEFPDHQTLTQTAPIARPGGYAVSAVARLDGVGFNIEPNAGWEQGLPLNEAVTWRWTLTPRSAGKQSLTVALRLRWTPINSLGAPVPETMLYTKGLQMEVTSWMGLTTREATLTGVIGLMLGGGLTLPFAFYTLRPKRARSAIATPNAELSIEHPTHITLAREEEALLTALFRRYARVTVEAEFRSGYSGARTFLMLPVHADGRADAYTIAKLGERSAMERECANFEQYVKDTLPPITARIQDLPITLPLSRGRPETRAALRYTFIGEPGRAPTSLKDALLAKPDPARLHKLFDTFGPNWWLQRKPYTFRAGQEFDRLLPAHYVLEPVRGEATGELDGRYAPTSHTLAVGAVVTVRNMRVVERRIDGASWSLSGEAVPGEPPLRARWQGPTPPKFPTTARVVATRVTLLRGFVSEFDLHGLPDPLLQLPALLSERVMGTQSIIHGDLNLENILVGPGGFVWLIDFAQTREGPPLYDFAHLEADLIAHVIAPQFTSSAAYAQFLVEADLAKLSAPNPLLMALHDLATRCLFNPLALREYQLALYLACLGALKFVNLNVHQKHLLYLTAARLGETL